MNYFSAILLLLVIAGAIGWIISSSSIVRAVCFRNVVSYFSSTRGYLFIFAFVTLSGFYAYRDEFFANNLANLDQLSLWFPILLLFIVPAITMSAWADEKKMGTDELLFTLPARATEILLGKYLAVLAIYTVALGFSMTHAVVLAALGDPDWGVLLATYFGYWIAGGALLAAGLVASALTSSTTVAFVLSVVICLLPVGIGAVSGEYQLLRQLSVGEQLFNFSNGLLSIASLAYFGSLIGFMLYLNKILISRRHWSAMQIANMGWHYTARVVCLAVALVSLNIYTTRADTTIDLTAEGLYSLNKATRDVISGIPKTGSVHINAYLTSDLPRQYVPVRKQLVGLLRQVDELGGKRVSVRIVDIEPFSVQAEEAEQKGIRSRQVQEIRGGKVNVENIFLGLVISGADEVVIPFCDVGLPLEYELTRSIRTAASEESRRRRIGVLNTDASLYGSFSFAGGMPRRTPKWQIVRELEKQFDVEQVAADSPIDRNRFDLLIAVLPSSLTMPQMTNLVSYVKSGKSVLVFDDPLPLDILDRAPRQPKPSPGGGGMMGMGRQPPPQPKAYGGKATALLDALDLEWNFDEIVWAEYNPHEQFSNLPQEIIFISSSDGDGNDESFNNDSKVTSGLQEIVLFFPGCVQAKTEDSDLSHDSLLRTVADSGTHQWDNLIQSSFGGQMQINPNPSRTADEYAQVIAYHVQGDREVTTKAPPPLPGQKAAAGGTQTKTEEINCIYVADIDVISDRMFALREQGLRPSQDAKPIEFDNVTFVLNCVDVLVKDEDLIPLRIRRAGHRTLSTVEEAKSDSLKDQIKQLDEAEKKFKDQVAEKQKELDDEVQKIRDRKTLDETTRSRLMRMAEERKNEELRQVNEEIEQTKQRDMRQIRNETERAIRSIEGTYKWAGILLPPLPAILLGILFLVMRLKTETSNIPSDRSRS